MVLKESSAARLRAKLEQLRRVDAKAWDGQGRSVERDSRKRGKDDDNISW